MLGQSTSDPLAIHMARVALSRAQAAVQALGIGAAPGPGVGPNFSITPNPGGLGPANTITFTAPAFTSRSSGSGNILVVAFMNVAAQAAADEVEFLLRKDAGSLVANTFLNAATGAGAPLTDATLFYVDTVTPGATHTYGIEAVNFTGGHTVQVASAGNVVVLVYELP